ncbi:MAG TPA: signal peptidase I [Verrucomicrobiae bacterium]|jgi:signal peptidase I|nr:signal peptidase I [Verrucomicrobiae bacterium]
MSLKWFASKTVRTAEDLCKHVKRILAAQRDLLSPEAVDAVETALRETKTAVAQHAGDEIIKQRIAELETIANAKLKPYPNAGIRENIEVILVALAVAMGIRTFVAQPFKIPTGSMQPTLFGVTYQNFREQPGVKPPGVFERIYEACVFGSFYHYQECEEDGGELAGIGQPDHFLKFFNKQSILVHYPSGDKVYTFWMTPDDGFISRASGDHIGIEKGQKFKKGEAIIDFKETAGDHLFVDRMSYNFRHPKRGEIIVFETKGIGNGYFQLPPDQFYIKRMVAMGGENVQIGNDRHLIINGKRLDKDTPHFENVYSFDPTVRANDSHYSGHLNQTVADQMGEFQLANSLPLFPDQNTVYPVPANHYMVMGDNTANSFDSRAWGDFSRTNVIGKYFFVYWPFSKRFGCGIK